MIIYSRSHGYSNHRKYIQGAGFLDTIKSIGSYIAQNKDLIAKPLLGAAGNLAALGLEKGIPELVSYVRNKKTAKANHIDTSRLTPTDVEIINNILNNPQMKSNPSLSNIIGSGGVKKF